MAKKSRRADSSTPAPTTGDSPLIGPSDSQLPVVPPVVWTPVYNEPETSSNATDASDESPAAAASVAAHIETDDGVRDARDIPPGLTVSTLAQTEAGFVTLRQWATRHGLTDDPFVKGLTTAVDARQDLSAWAAMSPFELLPHPLSKRGSGLRRIARLLHFLRNLLVFAPVALTWNSISRATDAFGKYADTRPGETLSFLDFWQSGGDGGRFLEPYHRIQFIALVDFFIIVAIIAMSLVAGLFDSIAGRRTGQAERVVEEERIQIAIAVKRALHGKREATVESISQSLGESLTDLMNAARMVNTAALRMESMSVGIESIGPRLEGFSAKMDELNARLGYDLQRAIDSLSTSVSRLGGTVNGELAQTLHQVLAGLDEIREQLGKTSASVEFGTKNLRDDLEVLHSQLISVTRGARL